MVYLQKAYIILQAPFVVLKAAILAGIEAGKLVVEKYKAVQPVE